MIGVDFHNPTRDTVYSAESVRAPRRALKADVTQFQTCGDEGDLTSGGDVVPNRTPETCLLSADVTPVRLIKKAIKPALKIKP